MLYFTHDAYKRANSSFLLMEKLPLKLQNTRYENEKHNAFEIHLNFLLSSNYVAFPCGPTHERAFIVAYTGHISPVLSALAPSTHFGQVNPQTHACFALGPHGYAADITGVEPAISCSAAQWHSNRSSAASLALT